MNLTPEIVADRFIEAVDTGYRLPPVRVQGYFNLWPPFARQAWEGFAERDYDLHPLPPAPAAIDRMLETIGWLKPLHEDDRHLIWLRARRVPLMAIARQIGCCPQTTLKRWHKAIAQVSDIANELAIANSKKYISKG
ncbi:MAG: DUF6362 family protein, partial [Pseudomonadota bacterium]